MRRTALIAALAVAALLPVAATASGRGPVPNWMERMMRDAPPEMQRQMESPPPAMARMMDTAAMSRMMRGG